MALCNSIYNILSLGLGLHLRQPLVVASLALLYGLGPEESGILTLIWTTVSNIVSSLSGDIDRFALGFTVFASPTSGPAQVPFAISQGVGTAYITPKRHLPEFPLYLVLLSLLIVHYGASGAARAWFIRIAADMAAQCYFYSRSVHRLSGFGASTKWKLIP